MTELETIVKWMTDHPGPRKVWEISSGTHIKREQVHSRMSTHAELFTRVDRSMYILKGASMLKESSTTSTTGSGHVSTGGRPGPKNPLAPEQPIEAVEGKSKLMKVPAAQLQPWQHNPKYRAAHPQRKPLAELIHQGAAIIPLVGVDFGDTNGLIIIADGHGRYAGGLAHGVKSFDVIVYTPNTRLRGDERDEYVAKLWHQYNDPVLKQTGANDLAIYCATGVLPHSKSTRHKILRCEAILGKVLMESLLVENNISPNIAAMVDQIMRYFSVTHGYMRKMRRRIPTEKEVCVWLVMYDQQGPAGRVIKNKANTEQQIATGLLDAITATNEDDKRLNNFVSKKKR